MPTLTLTLTGPGGTIEVSLAHDDQRLLDLFDETEIEMVSAS